jgi:hypothetical protein
MPELMESLATTLDDGEFWISYESLEKLRFMQCVPLLTSEWETTQKWISKFDFTLEKNSPVVLVLSQVLNSFLYTIY